MTVRIAVGGPDLTINRGDTFMVTDLGSEIAVDAAQGIFADDTRFVGSYGLRLNGRRWEQVSSAPVSYHRARIHLTNPDLQAIDGAPPIPEGTIGLTIDREIEGGVHEQLELVN
jgi:hypothetical protein